MKYIYPTNVELGSDPLILSAVTLLPYSNFSVFNL